MRPSDGGDRLGGRNEAGVMKRQAMSEIALRATPSVNIDEFERRLRATGSTGAAQDDPLAELARLLGAEDPPVKRVEPEDIKRVEAEEAKSAAELAPPRQTPRADSSYGQVVSVNFGGEPPARGIKPPPLLVEPPPYAPEGEVNAALRAEQATAPSPLLRPAVVRSAVETASFSQPRRRVWPMAALVVIGAVAGIGAWAYRGGVPGLTARVPPFIMAAAGPTKVQPPSQETVASQNDIASLLARDRDASSTAASLVSSKEQPVDLSERAKAQAATEAHAAPPPPNPPTIAAAPLVVIAAPAPTPLAAQPAAPPSTVEPQASVAPAAPVSPSQAALTPTAAIPASPAPSIAAPAQQPAAPAQQSASRSIAPVSASPVVPSEAAPVVAAGTVGPVAAPAQPTPFPEPKRVKTVSVRPDGSVIGAPPATQVPPTEPEASPSKLVVRPSIDASAAEPATPKLDLPAKLPNKTTARVPIAKIDTTVSGQSPDGPLQISPPAQRDSASKKHEANAHIAAADSATAADAAAPEKRAKTPVKAAASESPAETPAVQDKNAREAVKTAAAALDSATAADAAGSFAVQLAAPHSEAEAQSASTRLQTKFAGALDGLQPVIRKAELKDKTVYRVRVVGLSRAAAISLCEKLKAAGGACFLARE
jgi:hypothetical protein